MENPLAEPARPSLYMDDAETLIQQLLPLARTMLVRFGEFLPYAGTMTAAGEILPLFAPVDDAQLPAQEMIAALITECQEQVRRSFCAAAAICWRAHSQNSST